MPPIDPIIDPIEENYLTEDWFSKPYDDLIAEAKRVGALIGIDTHTFTLKPDTCDCKFEVKNDGDLIRSINKEGKISEVAIESPYTEVYIGKIFNYCPAHRLLEDKELFTQVFWKEMQRKNLMEGLMQQNVPAFTETKIVEGKEVAKYLFQWSFDEDRNLVVETKDYPVEAISKMKELADDPKFEGKVIIN